MSQPQNTQVPAVKLECSICDFVSADASSFQSPGRQRLCPYCFEAFLEQAQIHNEGNAESCFKCEGPLALSFSFEPHPSGEEVVNPNNKKMRRPRMRGRLEFCCRQNKCFKENVVNSWTGGLKHAWYAD